MQEIRKLGRGLKNSERKIRTDNEALSYFQALGEWIQSACCHANTCIWDLESEGGHS
jgi:hypothetical protein